MRTLETVLRFFFTAVFFLLSTASFYSRAAEANNVSVENAELTGQDSGAGTIKVEFDISWSNAWRDSINRDAVWVFVKYCTANCSSDTRIWYHAKLAASGKNPSGSGRGTRQAGSAFGSLDIVVPAGKTGAFIEPAHLGSGTLDFHDVQLVWDYEANGVSDTDASGTNTRIRVFALEMVYIPEGGFYAGDGSAGADAQFEYGTGSQNLPAAVNSEEGISFRSGSTDAWYYNNSGWGGEKTKGSAFDVNESFPKGFNAFYLMKYELTSGQYRDFLNMLTRAEQNTNWGTITASSPAPGTRRQNVRAPASIPAGAVTFGCDLDSDMVFNESNDGEWIPFTFLAPKQIMSYMDWAALRPITELEYEKAARGPLYPVVGEYAWGTTTITEARTLVNGGQASETVSESGNGLANYNNFGNDINGPARSGFAATSTTTTRAAAGAGYYGNLDLSGNLNEMVVSLGHNAGQNFAGTHGDGILTSASGVEGNATNSDWPGFYDNNSGVTTGSGSGWKGGNWSGSAAYLQISHRQDAARSFGTGSTQVGIRAARTSPEYE